jgi:hypothetical protein
MSTDRDVERIVRSWLDEGVNVLPDRVLDFVLDQVPATPQRRASWLARRFPIMTNAMRIAVAAVAVIVIAILGVSLLYKGGVGGPSATATPSPTASPRVLATGSFTSHGARIELNATGEGSNVNGSMTATDVGGDTIGAFTVDLACTRTTDSGLILIGGTVTASRNYDDWAPTGSNVAIVLQRGSPVKAFLHSASPGPCQAFVEGIPDLGEPGFDPGVLEPIAGTIDLGS